MQQDLVKIKFTALPWLERFLNLPAAVMPEMLMEIDVEAVIPEEDV